MKLVNHLLVMLSAFAASSLALQSIYVGHRTSGNTDKCGSYYAWFSDANPCTSGVTVGYYSCFNTISICDKNPYTILGHQGVSFIGCPPSAGGNTNKYPTGVLDAPNTNTQHPNLVCSTNGANGPLGQDLTQKQISCPPNSLPGTPYGFTVFPVEYCH